MKKYNKKKSRKNGDSYRYRVRQYKQNRKFQTNERKLYQRVVENEREQTNYRIQRKHTNKKNIAETLNGEIKWKRIVRTQRRPWCRITPGIAQSNTEKSTELKAYMNSGFKNFTSIHKRLALKLRRWLE